MSIHASPGVYTQIQDFSNYITQLSATTLGLIGKTKKGPSEPTFISSVRQFTDTYGLPGKKDYSALAAISYLEFGNALWFKRLVGKNATKASSDIPSANEVNENLFTTDGKQYIFEGTLAHPPIPGTTVFEFINADGTNPVFIEDDKDNGFDTDNYTILSAVDNYIDYSNGDFRFTLKESPNNDLVIKYAKKIYEPKITSTNNLLADGSTSRFNTVTKLSPYLGAKLNVKTVVVNTEITIDDVNYVETLTPKMVNGVCKLVNNEDVSRGTLTNGVIEFKTDEDVDLTPTSATLKGTFVTYDQIVLTKDGTAYEGSIGYPLNAGGVFVFDGEDIDNNNLNAILSDDNGKFVGEKLNTVINDYVNNIDYSTGKYRLVTSTTLSADKKINVNYISKYTQEFPVVSDGEINKAAGTIKDALVKKEVKVIIDNVEYAYDDGNGHFIKETIDENGNIIKDIVGEIIYQRKDTDGTISAYIEVIVDDVNTTKLTITYIKSIGKVEAYSYGESENNVSLKFFKEDPNLIGYGYYGIQIWNADTYISQAPTEIFRQFTLDDYESVSYFLNKVTSSLVKFELYDMTGNQKPLMNYIINLSGGYDDLINVNESTAIKALDDLADVESYDINLIAIPDYPGDYGVAEALIKFAEVTRGDCFALIDPPQGLSVQNKVAWHNGTGIFANNNALTAENGQAALWSSWVKINNQFTESIQFVPPSVKGVAVFAYSDSNGEIWYAPAGLNRGVLFDVISCEDNLNESDRDLLYATNDNAINPVGKMNGSAISFLGQKTLHRKPSALDRINVVRLMLYLTKMMATSVKYLLFEPHDPITWTQYINMVTPFLRTIKDRRGLYDFYVKCDSTTNTPSDIENNTMVAEIMLQPMKTVERIITRFKINSTGATLTDISVEK